MNSFKKNLDTRIYQSVDKHIQDRIKNELDKLEAVADNPDYIKHIQDRKKKILEDIFPNFDYNMNIIDEHMRFGSRRTASSKHTYQSILDGIIKKGIYRVMDDFYASTLTSKPHVDSQELNKILSIISDREVRVGRLLDDFDMNMENLNDYRKNTSTPASEPLMH